MATMYDSISADSIPGDAQIVAGYVDGWWADFNAVVLRFPTLPHASITVVGRDAAGNWVKAIVIDCENGDATPHTAAAWAAWMLSIGLRPTIYCNTATHPAVVSELAVLGLAFVVNVDWWEAHYDNDPTLSPGSVAKQYQSTDGWDVSSTDGSWPAVAPTPTPVPIPPKPTEANPMFSKIVTTNEGTQHLFQVHPWTVLKHFWRDKGQFWNAADSEDLGTGFSAQVPQVQFDPGDGKTNGVLTVVAELATGRGMYYEQDQARSEGAPNWGENQVGK